MTQGTQGKSLVGLLDDFADRAYESGYYAAKLDYFRAREATQRKRELRKEIERRILLLPPKNPPRKVAEWLYLKLFGAGQAYRSRAHYRVAGILARWAYRPGETR